MRVEMPEEFEWDEAKAAANFSKHRVAFDVAIAVFLDPDRADFDTSRTGEGEERRKVVGVIAGRIFTVVYTKRGNVCRLISARRANAREVRAYGHDPSSS